MKRKILITGDWHLDARTAGQPRFSDVEKAAYETVKAADREECEDYVFAGDLCDPDSPCVFRALHLACDIHYSLEQKGVRSWWVVGNHDVLEDGSGDNVLMPVRYAGSGLVIDEACVRRGIAFFPFSPLAKRYDPLTAVAINEHEQVDLVVSHLQLVGITPGSEREFARGRDVFLPVQAIQEAWPRAQIVNAHYHEPGRYGCALLTGSLVPLTKADQGDRGYVVVEVG